MQTWLGKGLGPVLRSKPRPRAFSSAPGRVREAASLTPPPSFLPCARSSPPAPASWSGAGTRTAPPVPRRRVARCTASRAESCSPARRQHGRAPAGPRPPAAAAVPCAGERFPETRAGWAGRGGAVRRFRRPPARELRAWGSRSSGAAVEVAFSSYVSPPSRCPVLWERVTAGASLASFELFQRWSPDLGCGIGGTMGAEGRDFSCC